MLVTKELSLARNGASIQYIFVLKVLLGFFTRKPFMDFLYTQMKTDDIIQRDAFTRQVLNILHANVVTHPLLNDCNNFAKPFFDNIIVHARMLRRAEISSHYCG